MPEHVVIAHIAAMVAPIAAVLLVVYALAPSARRALRWPLVAFCLLAAVLLVVAGEAGHTLLDELKATAPSAEYDAAYRHAENSAGATVAAVLAAVAAPLAGWVFLKPDGPGRRSGTVTAVILLLVGLGLAAATAYTVVDALGAVWGTPR